LVKDNPSCRVPHPPHADGCDGARPWPGCTRLRAGQPHMLARLDQWEGTARTHGMRCWLKRD